MLDICVKGEEWSMYYCNLLSYTINTNVNLKKNRRGCYSSPRKEQESWGWLDLFWITLQCFFLSQWVIGNFNIALSDFRHVAQEIWWFSVYVCIVHMVTNDLQACSLKRQLYSRRMKGECLIENGFKIKLTILKTCSPLVRLSQCFDL